MSTSNEVTLKEAIDKMLHAYKLKGKVYETQIVDKWPGMVGPMISKHTRELFLRKTALCIRVDSSALKQELSFMKTQIIETVNEELGQKIIDEVVLL